MRIEPHPVYLLHRRPMGERSQLLEIFSSEHGRIACVRRAAGARTGGEMQAFAPLLAGWSGRGELPTLGAVEPLGPALRLPGPCLAAGLYLNELLVRGLPRQDPAPALYRCYVTSLASLATAAPGWDWSLRLFERELLATLGLLIDVAAGQVGEGDAPVYFCPETGITDTPGPGRTALSAAARAALTHGQPPTEEGVRREVRQWLRLCIDLAIGQSLRARSLLVPR
jgi:DNA repair protein RecO (recombination protein O)